MDIIGISSCSSIIDDSSAEKAVLKGIIEQEVYKTAAVAHIIESIFFKLSTPLRCEFIIPYNYIISCGVGKVKHNDI